MEHPHTRKNAHFVTRGSMYEYIIGTYSSLKKLKEEERASKERPLVRKHLKKKRK